MSLKKWQGAEKRDEEDLQNLIIFGYHCKIFRDDEKALFIDKGNHLIPWMGDSSLMIDRYDGRGHISDLRPFDADNVDTTHYTLSDKEKVVEKAADEERYMELHTDALQHQQYEEEEMKRLYESMGEGYAAVAFNYEQPQALVQLQTKQEEEPEEDDDFPYEIIPELQVPKGVNLPESIKIHAIIEKTAAFVAKQGPQMEIVIATKQTNNRQFDFLHYSNELNVYYKHVVKMVKNGKYTPKPQEEYSKIRRRKSSENAGPQDYLHPSLGGGQENEYLQPQSQENFLKSVTDKLPTGQIANTAYAKLLSNLSKHRPESPVPSSSATIATKEISGKNTGSLEAFKSKPKSKKSPGDKNQPLVPGMDAVTLPGPNQPPPPGTEPLDDLPHHQLPSNEASSEGHQHPGYNKDQYHESVKAWFSSGGKEELLGGEGRYYNGKGTGEPVYYGPEGLPLKEREHGHQSEATIPSKRNTAREEEADSVPPDIKIPQNELRSIIDKMAQYVVRNGPQFETMMKSKKDERFSFLELWHKFNKYYNVQVEEFKRILAAEKGESEGAGDGAASQKGVSFSIKAKDSESGQVAPKKRRALLGESDDEDDDKSDSSTDTSSEDTDEQSAKEVPLKTYTQGNEEADIDRKIAEENLKNKLALAARGKLFQAREDDKVKAERKKKAAMFAALLKNNPAENLECALPKIPSVSSLASFGASREASPLPTTPLRGSMVTNTSTDHTSRSRTQSPAPVSVTKSKKKDRSRSRSPKLGKKKGRRKSRSRSRQRSRSRHRRRRRRSSDSSSPKNKKEVGLPSAYTVMRRSPPPRELVRTKIRSKSRSPVRHKRSKRSRTRSPKHSQSHRSRSRSRTRRHKRSKSKESRSKVKSKKRSKSHEKRKSKKSRKSKPKMIPIPELTKSGSSSHSEFEEEKDTITIEDSPLQTGVNLESNDGSAMNSLANSPSRASDVDSKCSENAVKPSENLLLKVRAMLRSQREERMKNGYPGD